MNARVFFGIGFGYLDMAQGALEDAQIRQLLVVDGRQLFP